jgi:hypothetical protein
MPQKLWYLSGEGCCPPPTMESLSSSSADRSKLGSRLEKHCASRSSWAKSIRVTARIRFTPLRSFVPSASPFARSLVAHTPRPILTWPFCPSEAFSTRASVLDPRLGLSSVPSSATLLSVSEPVGSSTAPKPSPRDPRTVKPPRQVNPNLVR